MSFEVSSPFDGAQGPQAPENPLPEVPLPEALEGRMENRAFEGLSHRAIPLPEGLEGRTPSFFVSFSLRNHKFFQNPSLVQRNA
jgi:hypothetical protein